MPCTKCGESARENGSHGIVFGLRYDDEGNASYTCFKCGKKTLENL